MAGSRPVHSVERPLLPHPLLRHGGVRLLSQRQADDLAQARFDLSRPPGRTVSTGTGGFYRLAGPGTFARVGHVAGGATEWREVTILRPAGRRRDSGRPD